jgi:hypothetical protein
MLSGAEAMKVGDRVSVSGDEGIITAIRHDGAVTVVHDDGTIKEYDLSAEKGFVKKYAMRNSMDVNSSIFNDGSVRRALDEISKGTCPVDPVRKRD